MHELMKNKIQLETFIASQWYLLNELRKTGYSWWDVKPLNHGRYNIIKGSNYSNIFIMYKRELFESFGAILKDEGAVGVGDTINCEDITQCITNNVKYIFSIFPDGKIYYISLQEFLANSIRWINKEGKEVRSISIHLYKRFDGSLDLKEQSKRVFQEKENELREYRQIECI